MHARVAIIGANGFVGRHVLELLSQQGMAALGVVRSEQGARVVEQRGGTALVVPDLEATSIAVLARALEGCDGLVYTASVTPARVASDRTDPSGLVHVVEACRQAGVPSFVFLSGLGIAHYGMNPHCTNPYFLAKMAGEVVLFRSGLFTTVFRPSYIFGTGDEFLSPLIRRMRAEPFVEIPGDGGYRLQPIAVADAARAILGAIAEKKKASASPRVVDLVGPETLSYRSLIERVASLLGRRVEIRERGLDEAQAQARATGYLGLRPHDLACLLCDEVSDPAPAVSLVGAPLVTLDHMIAETIADLRDSERVE